MKQPCGARENGGSHFRHWHSVFMLVRLLAERLRLSCGTFGFLRGPAGVSNLDVEQVTALRLVLATD